jgi:hypothetical protein
MFNTYPIIVDRTSLDHTKWYRWTYGQHKILSVTNNRKIRLLLCSCPYTKKLLILIDINELFLSNTTYSIVFEVLTATVKMSSLFWDITPHRPLKVNRRFGRNVAELACYVLDADFLLDFFFDSDNGKWHLSPNRLLIYNGLQRSG